MRAGLGVWGSALALSLLLHASLLGSLSGLLPTRMVSDPLIPLIEAKLMPAPRIVPIRAASPTPSRTPPRPTPATPPPKAPPRVASAPEPASVDPAMVETHSVPVSAEPPTPDELPVAEPLAPPAIERVLNALPPRLELHFQVHYGIASGQQTWLWVNEGARYTLNSVASATGFAGMFYRGQFVQTSRGRITENGLLPEEFWDQRGNKRSSARFDSAENRLTLHASNGASRHFSYEGEVHDVLSVFFQLALTAPPADTELRYTVFNGKKLRDYVYDVRGEVTLDTALGPVRTLHLVRRAEGEGRFEIWLAIERHFLPVRVVRSDDEGREIELVLRSIAP